MCGVVGMKVDHTERNVLAASEETFPVHTLAITGGPKKAYQVDFMIEKDRIRTKWKENPHSKHSKHLPSGYLHTRILMHVEERGRWV